MLKTLIDLKENHNAISLKAEFETEGADFLEVQKLKELADLSGLNLSLKIGGCEAIRDIKESLILGVNTLVAPMIESPYALKKFINAAKTVFENKEKNKTKFFINIETINGFNNLDEILNTKEADFLDGIVFGRSDMVASLGLSPSSVNNEEIFFYAEKIAQKSAEAGKIFILGGGINTLSIKFLEQISNLDKFETRKVIFDVSKDFDHSKIKSGIEKALEFELLWIKNKIECDAIINNEDLKRIETLKYRQEKISN